jgi:hypothetical protein
MIGLTLLFAITLHAQHASSRLSGGFFLRAFRSAPVLCARIGAE